MADVWLQMTHGQHLALLLVGGVSVSGEVVGVDGEWLQLHTEVGVCAIARRHIVVIGCDGALPTAPAAGDRPRRRRANAANAAEPAAALAVPDEDTLRRVANAILDGIDGPELRAIAGLDASTLRHVRRAFECARGNVQEEDLPLAARSLVAPIRHALGG